MRIHFMLNKGERPEALLADVEVHFEEGPLAGLKMVGCSVWRSKKSEAPTVLVPSRSYATAQGVRYFELLRDSEEGKHKQTTEFKKYIREEYKKITEVPA